jgi:8-oxo-dGTP diphosphatase
MPTIYLIRHAHAGSRHDWSGDDRERPLSDKGHTQAANLARALDAAGVTRVLASPAVRCSQTVEPLARAAGTSVEVRKELREGADPTKLIALIEELAPDTPALCGHGDVIPEVMGLLVRRGLVIEGPSGNNKGSWWDIDHDGDRFTTARWHPPA